MAVGTWMAWTLSGNAPVYALRVGGAVVPGYAAQWALIANLAVAVVGTAVSKAMGVAPGRYGAGRLRRVVCLLRSRRA
jgi:SSS family solute:Na+ symporter